MLWPLIFRRRVVITPSEFRYFVPTLFGTYRRAVPLDKIESVRVLYSENEVHIVSDEMVIEVGGIPPRIGKWLEKFIVAATIGAVP